MEALIIDDEPLARNELTCLLNEIGGFEEIDEAENVKETLETLLISQYDIMFLDVNLMDENGIGLGAKIQEVKESPAIIFAAAHDWYAVQAFELNTTDYILKPLGQKRIEQAVDKVHATKARDNDNASTIADDVSANLGQSLPVEVDDEIHMLKQQNIIGTGTHSGITTVHTTSHKYETIEPLSRYEKRLNPTYFIRIHRSYIIDTKRIKEMQQWFNYTYIVILANGVKMQVGRSFMKDFKASIGLL